MGKVSAGLLGWLRQKEALRLEAYRDPLSSDGLPITIGYGHAGPEVKLGMTITKGRAEELFQGDVAEAAAAVERLIPSGLNEDQFDALVSFTFNVGVGNLADSTLRKRILAGEPVQKVIEEELPRWVKSDSGEPEEGLITRRATEVDVAAGKAPWKLQKRDTAPQVPGAASGGADVDLVNFFEAFEGLEHQIKGIRILAQAIAAQGLLKRSTPWISTFSPPAAVATTAPKVVGSETRLILDKVPYLYQLDSEVWDMGPRMCFSSACAMLVEYLRPGALKGKPGQADDFYLALAMKNGGSASSEAQVKTLAAFGIKATFRQDGSPAKIKAQLRRGKPVPIGLLHHGPARNPTGFGHWILIVGFDDKAGVWICHDPNGELDNVNGGYVSELPTAGRFVRYSMKNLDQRFMVKGTGGWFMEVQ